MPLLLNLITASAIAAPSPQGDARPVNFVDDVQPIMREHCQSCHRGSRARNGLQLKTLKGIFSGGSSGAAVVPGDSSASLLYLVMAHEKSPNMPPDEDRLPNELLGTVRTWIDEGCRETATSKPGARVDIGPAFKPAALPTGAGAVIPVGARTQPVWSTLRANTVTAIAVSPNAPLAAVSGHEQITLYGLEDEEVLAVLPFPEGEIHSLRFSQTGAVLIGGGGRAGDSGLAVAWDVATGERLFELGEEPDVVLDADITLDHSTVILGGPDRIARAYSTSTGELLYELTKHNDWITACAFSPDGVLLATADRAGGLFIWEAQTGREFHQLEVNEGGINALDWRADSMIVAVGTNRGDIRQYEMDNGNRTRRWTAHEGVLALDFLADGRIATAGRNGFAVISNGDGSRSQSYAKAASPVTSIGATRDGAHVLVGTLTGGLRHCVPDEKQPISFLRVNPRTDEERAVARYDSHLAALEVKIPELEGAAKEQRASLDGLKALLPTAQQRADEAEAAAQQAAQSAAQIHTEELAAGRRLSALVASLSEKEAAVTAAETGEAALRTRSEDARDGLEKAIADVAAAEEALSLSSDDAHLRATYEEAQETLTSAAALSQVTELDLTKATATTLSAGTALSQWRARLESHRSEHVALEARRADGELLADQAQATTSAAANELNALRSRQAEAKAALAQTQTNLDSAKVEKTRYTDLLNEAVPAWSAMQLHLKQTGGRAAKKAFKTL
jgi:hypothetical protein